MLTSHRDSGHVHEAPVEMFQGSVRILFGFEAHEAELAELSVLGELQSAVSDGAEVREHGPEPLLLHLETERQRQTERDTDRQRERDRDRQRETQTDRERERERARARARARERERERERERQTDTHTQREKALPHLQVDATNMWLYAEKQHGGQLTPLGRFLTMSLDMVTTRLNPTTEAEEKLLNKCQQTSVDLLPGRHVEKEEPFLLRGVTLMAHYRHQLVWSVISNRTLSKWKINKYSPLILFLWDIETKYITFSPTRLCRRSCKSKVNCNTFPQKLCSLKLNRYSNQYLKEGLPNHDALFLGLSKLAR